MSVGTQPDSTASIPKPRKRKRELVVENLIIDPSLPEPISRKAQRKQRKLNNAQQNGKQDLSLDSQKSLQHSPIVSVETGLERSLYGVWIGNLPWSASKSLLKEFISHKASLTESALTRIHMPAPKKDQTSKATRINNKGFAYIDVKDEDTLEAVLNLNESLMGGRKLLIKNAKDFEGRPEKADTQHIEIGRGSSASTTHTKTKRIFVGNLGFDITKDDLFSHFQLCGEVNNLHMATFEDTGKCKGYAWITFATQEAADSAVKGYTNSPRNAECTLDKAASLNGSRDMNKKKKGRHILNKMQGRLLRCEFAEEPKTRYQKRYGKG